MASENDKAPGAADTSKKGEPSKLHIATGDRGTFVAPEIPTAPGAVLLVTTAAGELEVASA
jgi:hypothetical protein